MSQKEFDEALHEPDMRISAENAVSERIRKMKVRIEVIGDFENVRKVAAANKAFPIPQ